MENLSMDLDVAPIDRRPFIRIVAGPHLIVVDGAAVGLVPNMDTEGIGSFTRILVVASCQHEAAIVTSS